MSHTLDEYVRNDPRILELYLTVRGLYQREDLFHHNFEHVTRDLHRALLIAAEEPSVNYGVLIPAVLLHDIGFCGADHVRLGHDVAGALLAEEILKSLDYDQESIDAICHCVRAHKAKAEEPRTLEAKIAYDADVLEKAGLPYILLGGKLISEFRETLESFLARETRDRTAEIERNFYTQKARELDGGRLARIGALLREMKEEMTSERPDFSVDESALWETEPPAD